jgi:hypothetical protein
MSTSAVTERWPQRASRSTIQAGVLAWGLTLRTTRPEKRPHRSGASTAPAARRQLRRHRREAGLQQRRAGQRGHLAGDAVDAQAAAQVGRELEGEQRVVELQRLRTSAHRRIGVQLQQAAVVLAELQFTRRAQHALAFHAAQLAQLPMRTGLPVFALGGSSAPTSASGTLMPTRALGAPQTICSRPSRLCVRRRPAHPQAVGIRVLLGLDDLGHHHAAERRRGRAEVLHLHAGHGQQVGQFRGGQIGGCRTRATRIQGIAWLGNSVWLRAGGHGNQIS